MRERRELVKKKLKFEYEKWVRMNSCKISYIKYLSSKV